MASERSLTRARVVSSIAATAISIACGTNYAYSAWGPQFAEKLQLSSTESNLIGTSANMGMYAMGIPVGIFVDNKGPRPAVLAGALLLGVGYFPLRQAYVSGEGSLAALCFYAVCTGFGSCSAFAAAVKVSALNWPHHRGTATAFPLAAFGLSAFFFSAFAQIAFEGNTGDFLLLLAAGTSGIIFVSFFFMHIYPHSAYSSIPVSDNPSSTDSNPLIRTRSQETKHMNRHSFHEPESGAAAPVTVPIEVSETSSLLSSNASIRDDLEGNVAHKDPSHHVDIRGLRLFVNAKFWFLFALMGLLSGIGLMTINNIGNNATALWRHYDPDTDPTYITKRRAMHVSILSICSFVGRLLSGVGSDVLVRRLQASRTWCLTLASAIFTIAQLLALTIRDPHYLLFVSSLSGLAYGFLFGVFPSIVAEVFGIHGLSTNWGFITLAPVLSGNIFNLFYGVVFDSHSDVGKDGDRVCDLGLECYRNAYVVTLLSGLAALVVSLPLALKLVMGWINTPRSVKLAIPTILAILSLRKANGLLSQAVLNNFISDKYVWSQEVVVVTGGSGGLGDLLVRRLAAKGIKVISLDVMPPKTPLPANAFFYQADITSSANLAEVAQAIRSKHGDPTVLVNNAGVMKIKTMLAESEEEIRQVFDVNVIANFLLIKEFLPAMIKRNHGHIVTIASLASFITGVQNVDYSCSKAGALAMHEGLAQELRHAYNAKKVRTSIVHPTYIRTPLIDKVHGQGKFKPLLLEPEPVVETILNHILSGNSGQIFLPGRYSVGAALRGWPSWLQEAVRSTQQNVLAH
ncbi:hypothetical protein V502_11379 [Pseudogymnoascus sp. VKM F-4520 (FW-2644)]|nr:hypothetical protein V502_11379 [Pseudogymnoascus sp. VKM F-4520 (FW-2644)]